MSKEYHFAVSAVFNEETCRWEYQFFSLDGDESPPHAPDWGTVYNPKTSGWEDAPIGSTNDELTMEAIRELESRARDYIV